MPQIHVSPKNGDSFRHPIHTLQARLETLETEARGRLVRALGAGNSALSGLDEALARMSREDWSVPGLRRRLEALKARAADARATALKRVSELPGTAVSTVAERSRVPVQNLAKGLERIAKRLETAAPVEAVPPRAVPPLADEAKAPAA